MIELGLMSTQQKTGHFETFLITNLLASNGETRNPAVAGMADRTAPVVKLTRQKIVMPSGIGLAAVLAVGQLCLSL